MTNQIDLPTGPAPFLHALVGTGLLAVGGMLFVNLEEGTQTFMVLTVLFSAPGLFLLIAGAVAHGIDLARR